MDPSVTDFTIWDHTGRVKFESVKVPLHKHQVTKSISRSYYVVSTSSSLREGKKNERGLLSLRRVQEFQRTDDFLESTDPPRSGL